MSDRIEPDGALDRKIYHPYSDFLHDGQAAASRDRFNALTPAARASADRVPPVVVGDRGRHT